MNRAINVLQNDIIKMKSKLNNNQQLSIEDRQNILDSISDKQRQIENLSRKEPMVIDIPANKIKDRKSINNSRMSENRCII